MAKVFVPKTFSYYLGEQRALNGIVERFVPSTMYYLANTYDCDCNGQLTNVIFQDNTGQLFSLTPNVDFFSTDEYPNQKFFLLGTTTNTNYTYQMNNGFLFSSNSDCELVNCY